MYGPYRDLPSGRYKYWFDIEYDIPNCGVADDRILFRIDATRREGDSVGHVIPGSEAVLRWNWFCDSEFNEAGVFRAMVGYQFTVNATTPNVEIRLKQALASTTGISLEIVVKNMYLDAG